MKDHSLLLPIRFEVHFEIVLIEMSYTLFTSVRDSLEMGWLWISNSGCRGGRPSSSKERVRP